MNIPKKYQKSIHDIYRDEDGWWIVLKEDGVWVLDGYYSEWTIHEDTKAEAVNALRDYAVKR